MNPMIQLSGSANLSFSLQSLTRDCDEDCIDENPVMQLGSSANLSSSLQSLARDCIDEPDCGADSNSFESLTPRSSPLEGTCTVVLHPGDVLEYDPAEYLISEKDFQVNYECTKKLKHRLQAKKSKTQILLKSMSNLASGNAIDKHLENARHVISGKKKEGTEYVQRKIHELPDAVGNHGDILIKRAKESETVQKVLAAGGLRTQAGIECDVEKGQGPLPTLLRSQGVVAEKVKRTTTIDWQDVEAAYTYGYLKKHMSESQLTQCVSNSYGHLDDDMDKAVFIQYTVPGYPEAWLCLLVEDNVRDIFVNSLNAHAQSAKERKAEQEALVVQL